MPPKATLPREWELLERVPKEKGQGAARRSTGRFRPGAASHRKAKRPCPAQSSALEKPRDRGCDPGPVVQGKLRAWGSSPDQGRTGHRQLRASGAFGSLLPGCGLSSSKARSPALAGDNLAEMADARRGQWSQGIRCSCQLHVLLGRFLQPSKAALTPFLVSQEHQHN